MEVTRMIRRLLLGFTVAATVVLGGLACGKSGSSTSASSAAPPEITSPRGSSGSDAGPQAGAQGPASDGGPAAPVIKLVGVGGKEAVGCASPACEGTFGADDGVVRIRVTGPVGAVVQVADQVVTLAGDGAELR